VFLASLIAVQRDVENVQNVLIKKNTREISFHRTDERNGEDL